MQGLGFPQRKGIFIPEETSSSFLVLTGYSSNHFGTAVVIGTRKLTIGLSICRYKPCGSEGGSEDIYMLELKNHDCQLSTVKVFAGTAPLNITSSFDPYLPNIHPKLQDP